MDVNLILNIVKNMNYHNTSKYYINTNQLFASINKSNWKNQDKIEKVSDCYVSKFITSSII